MRWEDREVTKVFESSGQPNIKYRDLFSVIDLRINNFAKNCVVRSYSIFTRGGVFEDVLGLEDVLKDAF